MMTYQEDDAIGVGAQISRGVKHIITKRPGHAAHAPHQTHGKIMRVETNVLPLPHVGCNVMMVVVVVVVVVLVTFRMALALIARGGRVSRCGDELEAVVAARVTVTVNVVVAARLVVLGARNGEGNGSEGCPWGGPGKG